MASTPTNALPNVHELVAHIGRLTYWLEFAIRQNTEGRVLNVHEIQAARDAIAKDPTELETRKQPPPPRPDR